MFSKKPTRSSSLLPLRLPVLAIAIALANSPSSADAAGKGKPSSRGKKVQVSPAQKAARYRASPSQATRRSRQSSQTAKLHGRRISLQKKARSLIEKSSASGVLRIMTQKGGDSFHFPVATGAPGQQSLRVYRTPANALVFERSLKSKSTTEVWTATLNANGSTRVLGERFEVRSGKRLILKGKPPRSAFPAATPKAQELVASLSTLHPSIASVLSGTTGK